MASKTRLELTWIGKDVEPRLEPRILIEDKALSYHAARRVGENDQFDNRLIHGDNLLALKALEQEFTGKVKCVFIDPPYNTFSAFKHYDDGIEHSLWLSLIRDRLEILRKLLRQDGSIWIAIDDNECHYLKVLCDEIFGRSNFLGNVVWQSKDTPGNDSTGIAQTHNHILAYRRSAEFRVHLLGRNEEQIGNYRNPDDDPRGPWARQSMIRAEYRERDTYALRNPAGREVFPPKGSSWRRPLARIKELESDGRLYWGKTGDTDLPVEKKFLSEVKQGVVSQTWWPYEFAGSTRNASAEMKAIFDGQKAFETPKPEKLVSRIVELATDPGDLVLDSFAGSGTTGAVAQKMARRWIMVELGGHCHTLVVPRLKKVIDGTDPGGITESVGWKGGGGFRYYKLAPSLLTRDSFGNWVISPDYNPAMLSEAVCKHEGFRYDPSPSVYWQQGRSTESDFIYVTTQTLGKQQLVQLSHEVGESRTLLVCCGAFRTQGEELANLTIKKIPNTVLHRCEWGRDDYSLEVAALPAAEASAAQIGPAEPAQPEGKQPPKGNPSAKAAPRVKKQKVAAQSLPLFGRKKGE